MIKFLFRLFLRLMTIVSLTGCFGASSSGQEAHKIPDSEMVQNTDATLSETSVKAADSTTGIASGHSVPDAVLDSYYVAQSTPVFEYFHHSQIQKFLSMWVKEETGDIEKPKWDYDSFTRISVLDHDLAESRPDEQLYCIGFSDGEDRYGYVIAKYDDKGPSIGNWSVTETTPYLYDLRANMDGISASLKKTDIDLSTAKASRVYLFDKENNRADQVIRFTDGKGDNYICYFGDPDFKISKWDNR